MNETREINNVVLGVVFVGVTLVIGIFILAQMSGAFDTDNTGITVLNEAGFINSTGYQLDGQAGNLTNAAGWAITLAVNSTDGETIIAANYTVSSSGLVLNATPIVWDAATLNYTYTASVESAGSAAANSSVTALASGTPWLTILIVVAFAMIVLGFLTSGFNGRRNRDLVY